MRCLITKSRPPPPPPKWAEDARKAREEAQQVESNKKKFKDILSRHNRPKASWDKPEPVRRSPFRCPTPCPYRFGLAYVRRSASSNTEMLVPSEVASPTSPNKSDREEPIDVSHVDSRREQRLPPPPEIAESPHEYALRLAAG